MTTEQKYVVTQDTQSLFREIDQNLAQSEQFREASNQYFGKLQEILGQTFPDKQVLGFTQDQVDQELKNLVDPFLKEGAACICLDRFLLKEVEEGETTDQFYRFGICRTATGDRENRQARPDFSEQFQDLLKKIPDIQERSTVIVDDGLFTGGTIKEFLELAKNNGVNLNVGKIIGFLGDSSVIEDRTELAEPIDDLYEWIDIRDFSPLGGKLFDRGRANKVTSAIPYLFPWSDGKSPSMDMSPDFFDTSTAMIREFQTVVRSFENGSGTPLTFRRLVKAGFPLPTNAAKTIPVSINDTVTDYLDRCVGQIEIERNRTVDIFDMDGTLYQLDGDNNGFKGSSLESKISENALQFIQDREGCSVKEAKAILEEGVQDAIGPSKFLADRYRISREEYFNYAWNIDPKDIVRDYETAVDLLQFNRQAFPQAKTILLTAAPKVWANNVLAFLGVTDCFEVIYTGEQFKSKEEVFQMLAKRYKPGRITSIGDQDETDIFPARKYGIDTIKITKPFDLENARYLGGILTH